MMEILDVVAILVAGLMVGVELAIAVFVHPALEKLPDDVHLPVAVALARVLGKFMPFWYALVSLLAVTMALTQWHQSDRLPGLITTSAFFWLLSVVFSIAALVPINNRIASISPGTPPADWKIFRRKWDLLHRWRVALLMIAFAFLVVAVVGT